MAIVSIDRPALNLLRIALSNARAALIAGLFEAEDSQNAFEEVQRRFSPGSPDYAAADTRRTAAQTNLTTLRANDTGAYDALQQGLSSWLFDQSTETDLTVQDDVSRLDQRYPL